MLRRSLLLCALCASLVACQSAYYGTLEKFGIHKRDVLAGRIEKARGEQSEAKQQFLTTLEAFQAVVAFDGGDLQATYLRLQDEYDESVAAAQRVSGRIDSIESVSDALFEEWGSEIEEISDVDMRASSEALRNDSMARYDSLIETMRTVEAKMDPVLTSFNDRVLVLKHQLNAQAIASLKQDSLQMEDRVRALIADMQVSIDEADAFLATLGAGD